jgi:hypothetical protein
MYSPSFLVGQEGSWKRLAFWFHAKTSRPLTCQSQKKVESNTSENNCQKVKKSKPRKQQPNHFSAKWRPRVSGFYVSIVLSCVDEWPF